MPDDRKEAAEASDDELELQGTSSPVPASLFRAWWNQLRTTLRGGNSDVNEEAARVAVELRGLAGEHARRPRLNNEEMLTRIEHERQRAAQAASTTAAQDLRAPADAAAAAALAYKTYAEAEKIVEETKHLKQQRMLELLAAAGDLEARGYKIEFSDNGEPTITLVRRYSSSTPEMQARMNVDFEALDAQE
jgi:hypothetical protein